MAWQHGCVCCRRDEPRTDAFPAALMQVPVVQYFQRRGTDRPPVTTTGAMIGYILALLPLYIFVYLPISQLLLPSSSSSSSRPSSSSLDHEPFFNASFIAPEDRNLICPDHYYNTYILSHEPLVLYLESWLSEEEITHLIEISADQFAPSHVSTGPINFIDPAIRRSEVATLPRSLTVRCIEARARALQGWSRPAPSSPSMTLFGWSPFSQSSFPAQDPPPPERKQGLESHTAEAEAGEEKGHSDDGHNDDGGADDADDGRLVLERLKIQRYGVGGHYTHHYDWQGAGRADRVSSFMVYVDANCTGGGTAFPRLPRPRSRRWCRFVDCAAADSTAEGVTFKPVRGNAIFWENLRADGTGYVETWHAGLPVETGTKIGLNIWTWYRF